MKKLIIWLALLLPFIANAQVNGTIQKTASSGTIRGSFGSLGIDTIPRVTGVLVNGYILKYNAATNKWYASPDPTLVGLQDSLTKKANRTFDNVASGAIVKAKVDTSANGLLPKSNLFPLGDTRYAKGVGDAVLTTGNQSIAGTKTFTTTPVISGGNALQIESSTTGNYSFIQSPVGLGASTSLVLPNSSGTLALQGGNVNQSQVVGLQDSLNTREKLSNKATDFSVINNTLYPTVQAAKSYADGLVVGLLNDRGSYDASTNLYPSTGGSGTGGAIMKGNLWAISVAGTLGGTAVGIGDWIRALTDSPGQTSSNWGVVEGNFGYVPENVANKATSLASPDNIKYPSTAAVSTALGGYLPLTGGTLTGPLNGTIATFSGNATINGGSIDINPSSGQSNITLRSGNTFRGFIEGNSSGGLSFGAGPSATIYATITSTGNVGIGTTSPGYNLDVNGTGRFSGTTTLSSLSGTGTRMVVADPSGVLSTQAIPSGGGGGSVTGVAVATANGLSGTSDGASVVPTLTLSTTVNGMIKGNGTSLSAAVAGTDYTTPSSTETFTNKSGNISQWTNDIGYITSSALTPYAPLNSPTFTGTVSGITAAMVGAPSGSGTSTGTNTGDQTNISGNAGTATALQTARTISGVSFDGTSNITLNNNAITNGAGYITASSSNTLTNKSGNISQWTNDSGYITSSGSVKQLCMQNSTTNSSSIGTVILNQCSSSSLSANGNVINFVYGGEYAVNGNNKSLSLEIGGTTVFSNSSNANGIAWQLSGTIIRQSSNVYRVIINWTQGSSASVTYYTGTVTDFSPLVISLVAGTATTTGDLLLHLASLTGTLAP